MIVRARMNCGLPLFAFFALLNAFRKAAMSWPSTVWTSHPIALNLRAVFSLWVMYAMASSVTSFES